MINIRRGCYETNSSSCHSICISKTPAKDCHGSVIDFQLDGFGWDEDEYHNTEDYLYTAIVCENPPEKVEQYLNRLKKILDKHGIHYNFEPYQVVHSSWGDYCTCQKNHSWDVGIDHGNEVMPLVNKLLDDEDMLLRFLLSDSVIYTGNDNSCEADNKCFLADVYNEDVPGYRPDLYDYFYKGN